jgi:hypothetical protein
MDTQHAPAGLLLVAIGAAGFMMLAAHQDPPEPSKAPRQAKDKVARGPATVATRPGGGGAGGELGGELGGEVAAYAPAVWSPTTSSIASTEPPPARPAHWTPASPAARGGGCGAACARLRQLRLALDETIAGTCGGGAV